VEDRPVGYVTSGTMVPYWKFEGQGISSRIGPRKRPPFTCPGLRGCGPQGWAGSQISSRGKLLSGPDGQAAPERRGPSLLRPILVEEISVKKPGPQEPLHRSVETLVRKARENTLWRQTQTVNLIPSEQTPSPLVKLLSISDPCSRLRGTPEHKFLGEADVFYYQGTDFIEWVEVKLQERDGQFLGCTMVETRIISGQMANAAVYSSFIDYLNRVYRKINPRRFRKVMNHQLGRGGHLSSQPMGALRDFISVAPDLDRMAAVEFPVQEENPYQIDLKQTEELLHRHKPDLIILGKSMVSVPGALGRVAPDGHGHERQKPGSCTTWHNVLGLIGPHFQRPFHEGADLVTGSTIKIFFFGTQRGSSAATWTRRPNTMTYGRPSPGGLSREASATITWELSWVSSWRPMNK